MESGHVATVRTRRGPRGRRVALWGLLVLLLAVVALVVLLAWQARTAYVSLSSAADRIPQLREQVIAGDDRSTQQTVAAFREDTAEAREAVHGPHWSLVGVLPEVGPNVRAMQTVTEVVDDLADDALPELVEASQGIDPANLAPRGGRVDLAPVEQAAPHVVAAHRAVVEADDRLADIESDALLERLRAPVDDLSGTVAEARSLTGTASKAARLLPSMLGGDGPRRYLVLAQNNSEPRALGGLPGAAVVIGAHNGRIRLIEQTTAFSFPEPVRALQPAERSLYGTQMGRYFGNVTSTPDFPRAARLAREMWRRQSGQRVDGVASLDPYALQLLVGATGPVRLPTGQRLTGENVAKAMLNQAYLDIPDDDSQDAFFAAAAAAIFERAMSGAGDLQEVGQALAEGTQQGRVRLWSAHRAEQRIIADTPLGGVLRGARDGAPVVGVYLHDRSGAKIAYYEHLDVEVRPSSCSTSGPRELEVRATVSSDVPRRAEALPDLLTGGGNTIPVGNIRTDVLLYAPRDAVITDVKVQPGRDAVATHFHEGLQVAKRTVMLRPGKSATLEYTIRIDGDLPDPPQVRVTPLATPKHISVLTSHCN